MTQRGALPKMAWAATIIAAAVVVFIATTWRAESHTARVIAAPHVVAAVEHPFDPDWPEVWTLVSQKCGSCHRAKNDRSDFTSYELLITAVDESGDRLILPGNAECSTFFEQVDWNVHARRDSIAPDQPTMPPEQSEWLTAGQISTIRRWIDHGALEYKLPDQCSPRPLMEIDFPSAKVCKGCHPRQYGQWSSSMHAYAQHSPVFEAFNLTLIERTSGTIDTFCSRCHTPVGTILGENGSLRNVHRSRISMEGVTCIVCHRREDARYKSNGRLRITPGDLNEECIYGPFESSHVEGVDFHPSKSSPYIKTSQFCGECHDVTSPAGVRLEEAFSEWQNSPAARQGTTCQHCHMGPVQGVAIPDNHRPWGRSAEVPGVPAEHLPLRRITDHSFAGPDYSLLPDTEFPHKLDWMYEVDYRNPALLTPHQQSTLTALRHKNRQALARADAKRFEVLSNAARLSVSQPNRAKCGERIKIAVDVKSIFSGHNLPTGFTAERQVWVSVEVFDPQGRRVFATGDLDDNRDLRDSHSHDVLTGAAPTDRHLMNFQNKFISLTTRGTERSVVLPVNRDLAPLSLFRPAAGIPISFGRPFSFRIAKGSIPPLASRGKTYHATLHAAGPHRLLVRLHFRNLPPNLLDHIGAPHLKQLLEDVVIAEHQAMIQVDR